MKTYNNKHFNFKNFNIYCYGWETSNAWGHHATLFNASSELATEKARYYNRTWERYDFQSVILSTIEKAICQKKQRLFDDYKYNNNIKRLSNDKKAELVKDDNDIKDLREAYKYFDKEYQG